MKKERNNKEVTIEARGAEAVRTMMEKGFLSNAFTQAIAGVKSASLTVTGDAIDFTASRKDFMALIERGVIAPDIVEAFNASDKRQTVYDAERSGFFAQLWDSLRFQSELNCGRPLVYCPTEVKGVKGIQVTVKRYGLA